MLPRLCPVAVWRLPRLAPAQNALPAPVTTTAPTPSSASKASIAAPIPVTISAVSVLRSVGLLSVNQPTPSRTSVRTSGSWSAIRRFSRTGAASLLVDVPEPESAASEHHSGKDLRPFFALRLRPTGYPVGVHRERVNNPLWFPMKGEKMIMSKRLLAAGVVAALALAACGDDDDNAAPSATTG